MSALRELGMKNGEWRKTAWRLKCVLLVFSVAPALPLLAIADTSALRLAEATKPDWRGDNGLVFAADNAMLAFDGDGAGAVASVRRAPNVPPTPVTLAPAPAHDGRWLLQLP